VRTNDHNPHPGSNQPSTEVWTQERIRALGPVTDVATAARIFGLSRAAAYDLAKRGQFPVSVLRFGSRYRVPVAAILQALHLPVDDQEPPGASPATTT
jgi:predicted DNA-binding transcriptional regulator AlpA